MMDRKVNSATASSAPSRHEVADGTVPNELQRTAERPPDSKGTATPDECIEIAVALVQRGGHFVVGVRNHDDPLAGKAEFPGGKVEANEPAAEAARRECLEETGLKVTVTGLHSIHVEQYDHVRVRLHFFNAQSPTASQHAPDALPPLPAPWRWVPQGELATLDFPAGNRCVIQDLSRAEGSSLHE